MSMRLPAQLYKRRADTHKRDYGHVFILAGSKRFVGAACLCAESALRAGAGLVTLGFPEGIYPVIALKVVKEVMLLPLPQTVDVSLGIKALKKIQSFSKKCDCVLIGPGLSTHIQTKALVRSLVTSLNVPMVIDADGLRAIEGRLNILKKSKADIVLTPHPGEMAGLLECKTGDIQKDRKNIAKDFALRYNITLILKGSKTIVASCDGKVIVNPTGNPGMATAGSGDCLAGILAAFIGQKIPLFEAASLAAYIHGLAGDLAVRDKTQACLIASDIIQYLPKAFKRLITRKVVSPQSSDVSQKFPLITED